MLQRRETTVGPVAVDGRTITLVAKTRALRVGGPAAGAMHVRARPDHVEVLDEDGRRQVFRIHDVETTLVRTIVAVSIGCAIGLRALRRRKV
ncbi:MAG TPA: hypothetical protein VL856_08565 [Acidimicrobiia bacterium]|jgi:hypothetical protein|nr:hypothetical protein [Acidimicrobiia bacterium]